MEYSMEFFHFFHSFNFFVRIPVVLKKYLYLEVSYIFDKLGKNNSSHHSWNQLFCRKSTVRYESSPIHHRRFSTKRNSSSSTLIPLGQSNLCQVWLKFILQSALIHLEKWVIILFRGAIGGKTGKTTITWRQQRWQRNALVWWSNLA